MVVVVADNDVATDSLLRLAPTSDEGMTIAVVLDPGTLAAAVATTVVTVDTGPLLRLSWVTIGEATTSDKDGLVILLEFSPAVDTSARTAVSTSSFRSIGGGAPVGSKVTYSAGRIGSDSSVRRRGQYWVMAIRADRSSTTCVDSMTFCDLS